jgi:hypothetical protein
MIGKSVGAVIVLFAALSLAPAVWAGDLEESITTYVAQTEGEPMRVAGTPEPVAVEAERAPTPAASGESWEFTVIPYLWAIGIDGGFTVRGLTADVEADFGDLVSNLDMAFCLRAEAWHGPIGITLDFAYFSMSKSPELPLDRIRADLGGDTVIGELGFSYKFDWPLTGEPGDKRLLTIEPIVGLRYVSMDSDLGIHLGPVSLPKLRGSEDWLEPFVGFRTKVQITDRLTAAGGVNFGGFSIGSRLTWVAFLGVDYRFSELISVKLGYKYMDIDYSSGSGNNRFAVDAVLKGLWLGVAFHF